MIKAVLQHSGGSVDLFEGEVVIGRGLSCPIRFNDHTISRKHVKLHITADGVTVRDLGSRNGTRINNTPLDGTATLHDRDILQIGSVQLRLAMITTRQTFMDEVVTSPDAAWGGVSSMSRSPDTVVDEIDPLGGAQVETDPIRPAVPRWSRDRSRKQEWEQEWGKPADEHAPITLMRDSTELPIPDLTARTCPDCRTQVPIAQQQCHNCGYKWRFRGPMSKTQVIVVGSLSEFGVDQDLHDRAMERRAADRKVVEVPIIYHSDNLTFDARAQNLSRTGMFIASDLLDATGTACTLRVLPDGHQAVSISGLVKRVVTSTNADGDQVPGMGIRFQKMSRGALSWIWSVLGDPLEE
jgi:hypothetical protein